MRKSRNAIAYNPADSTTGYRWIEHASRGLRVVGAAHELTRLRHTGWYLDSFQDDICHGAVLQLPGRDGSPRYVPAVSDPWNDDAYLVDFASVTDDKAHAASWADGMAERYAERCREDDAKFQAEAQIEEAQRAIKTARGAVATLLRELRDARQANRPRFCGAIRDLIARHRDDVHEAVKRIRALQDNPWTAVSN